LYAFVDEFVDAVQEVFPNCCIHFEDWTGSDAIAPLARYRNKVSCYNDDIQGTGGVTLALSTPSRSPADSSRNKGSFF
jgi:malate dehydrogenase (oxaloacetate-decarboxylating)(NADP+)